MNESDDFRETRDDELGSVENILQSVEATLFVEKILSVNTFCNTK